MVDVTTTELDALVKKFIDLRGDYEAKKKVASEASAVLDSAEAELLDLLKAANKTKYNVDGLGSVTKVSKLSFKVPKEPGSKAALFNYILDNYGADVLLGLQSINSISLNAFFKDATETPMGLESPTSQEYLKFTRS